MKEKVTIFSQYGKQFNSRNTYDFTDKTLFEKIVSGVIWSGAFVTIGALALGFLWLFGG